MRNSSIIIRRLDLRDPTVIRIDPERQKQEDKKFMEFTEKYVYTAEELVRIAQRVGTSSIIRSL